MLPIGELCSGEQVLKRLPRSTPIGKPDLFGILGFDVRPGLWQVPVQHELHVGGRLFLGLRLAGTSLWTAKGNRRRIKRIDAVMA